MSRPQLRPTSQSFISRRLRLNYLDWGNEDAPLLILQHGGRDHAHSWDWAARDLCEDWHVIAPDLCGHGDSAWSPDGVYQLSYFIYDFAQLIHLLGADDIAIIAHSLGGNIATAFAGLYPEKIRRLVNIEGLGLPPQVAADRSSKTLDENWRGWIGARRSTASRQPRRYKTIEEAFARMHAENGHLSPEQARHLTVHGIARNEDGTWSWKFDNYVHTFPPYDIPAADLEALWSRITCPVLLVHGAKSWAPHPDKSGKAKLFKDAKVVSFEGAGHWPHHDQFDGFMHEMKAFL